MMTDEWMRVIDMAEELSEMLLCSEVVKTYQDAHNRVYSNADLRKKIMDFTKMKEQYEDVQRFGRYHPDYKVIMKEIRVQKRELDLQDEVAALRLAENDVQDLLDEIGILIGQSVSEAVKVPAGDGTFSNSSCGSGCGSGGSCSCSA
ncbi:regulator [Sporosarcina sp. P21c]|uniref:YlbF family regulator n=1 Tax=Sporosarcina TaxID=1569 RepID=UPI000A1582AA|nr:MULTISPECIES: YlbF family regulator [Sporosarcina]ARJ40492.1 regulator [Sporosarcina ureae]PIC68900.1 regulator [Sporosarcina sp. P16a]PIC84853.1 regulator [Sporosarcina sp. P1]PIC90107.1 regulator [Sporosarcina sp. P21c]PIC91606.1 regulator [Sporosarcina sp. P25]